MRTPTTVLAIALIWAAPVASVVCQTATGPCMNEEPTGPFTAACPSIVHSTVVEKPLALADGEGQPAPEGSPAHAAPSLAVALGPSGPAAAHAIRSSTERRLADVLLPLLC